MKKIQLGIIAVLGINCGVLAQSSYDLKCTKCNVPLEPVGCSFGSCLMQKLNMGSKEELSEIFSPDIAGSIISIRGGAHNNASIEAYKQYFGRESFDELARSFELYFASRKDVYGQHEEPVPSGKPGKPVGDFSDPLFFDENESTISGSNARTLNELAGQLKENREAYVVIHGYANESPASSRNRELSLKRAQAVKEYLAQHGADPKRLLTIAHGDDNPIAPNTTTEGRSKNRRVSLNVRQRS